LGRKSCTEHPAARRTFPRKGLFEMYRRDHLAISVPVEFQVGPAAREKWLARFWPPMLTGPAVRVLEMNDQTVYVAIAAGCLNQRRMTVRRTGVSKKMQEHIVLIFTAIISWMLGMITTMAFMDLLERVH